MSMSNTEKAVKDIRRTLAELTPRELAWHITWRLTTYSTESDLAVI